MDILEFFRQNRKVAVAFSGGVDSSFLLYLAKFYGADVRPYYVKTAFQPEFEYNDARRICEELEIELTVIEQNIVCQKEIVENPKNRCYFCKKFIFGKIVEAAKKDGYDVVLDGTNASDDINDRPGMKAIEEYKVLSPLRLCGYTKDEIRKQAKEARLFIYDKPAYACLATRIPTGTEITPELLGKVERSEESLMEMGFNDFRVRVYHDAARIQVHAEEFEKAVKNREEIRNALSKYFSDVFLDLQERKS